VVSQYKNAPKVFTSQVSQWVDKFQEHGLTENQVQQRVDQAAEHVKALEKDVKQERKILASKESMQSKASHEHKLTKRDEGDIDLSYQKLYDARLVVRDLRRQIIPKEVNLKSARQTLRYWNNVLKGAKVKEKADKKGEKVKHQFPYCAVLLKKKLSTLFVCFFFFFFFFQRARARRSRSRSRARWSRARARRSAARRSAARRSAARRSARTR
jgi:L-lysine 2,3-aminomutase